MKGRAFLVVVLLFALSIANQSQRPTVGPARYYFDITRPDCCRLSDKEWQRIGTTLRVNGIPTFFGLYDVLNYQEHWHPVKLRRTPPDEGWLILGPFDSETTALKALNRLPRLLPNHMQGSNETRNGVESGPTGDSQTWQIGMYQINGVKTTLPIQVQRPTIIHQAGVVEGVVVEKNEGASGYGVTVEAQGERYYVYLVGNMGGVKAQTGDVETVGNHVRITYKSKRKASDGTYSLDATSIVQIKRR